MAGGKLLPNGRPERRSAKVESSDSVVFGFRAQALVTRARVAVITGVSTEEPQVVGVYDTLGNRA